MMVLSCPQMIKDIHGIEAHHIPRWRENPLTVWHLISRLQWRDNISAPWGALILRLYLQLLAILDALYELSWTAYSTDLVR